MQPIYYYLIIFVMGVLCSLSVMVIFRNFRTTVHKIPNYMSDVHYLQVRDDYSIYSLTAQRSGLEADQTTSNNIRDKKKNFLEGKLNYK